MRAPWTEVKKHETISLMMRAPSPGPRTVQPRQKRARKTRAALLAAVERIAAAEEAEAVTTTRVAAETGMAVGTIYRYFADREGLLLAAYDATVARIVEACAARLEALDAAMPTAQAAQHMLAAYLEAADAIPAHANLLRAMRAIRPVGSEQGGNEAVIVTGLLEPFLVKFAGTEAPAPERLHFMSVLLGTLVDLYLVTPEGAERARLRDEIEAHMLLALTRTQASPASTPTG